jgi:glutathione S-transferase
MVNWLRPAGFDPGEWPRLKEYRVRLLSRPSVQAALEAEGLKKRAASATA